MDDVVNWRHKVRLATDEELVALRQADYLGLRNTHDPDRNVYIRIVEEEIQLRGITDATLTDNTPRAQVANGD
jgi:hypothetical protein